MLWIFDEGESLKKMLLATWMLDGVDCDHHIYGNNKQRLNLQKECKDVLCDISV